MTQVRPNVSSKSLKPTPSSATLPNAKPMTTQTRTFILPSIIPTLLRTTAPTPPPVPPAAAHPQA